MKVYKILIIPVALLLLGSLFVSNKLEPSYNKITLEDGTTHTIVKKDPPCLQLYQHIEYYTDSLNIPKKYAYGIAYYETRYKGPFHWDYKHDRESSAGALGPMQIMPLTAKSINGEFVSKEKLREDIKYNVMTSMKLVRKLYNKYNDWLLVFGHYNTGRPIVNDYAHKVYNFTPNWGE